MNNNLTGGQLSGGNSKTQRADNDFYATDPKAVIKLLENYEIKGNTILEPCVGNGNIVNVIKDFYNNSKQIDAIDIVDRGYENTIVSDFITYDFNKKYDCIITNPPYSNAQDFINKGIGLLNNSGQMIMFLKLQFLEGIKRKELFERYPPKYIYVFRSRMATWKMEIKLIQKQERNGQKQFVLHGLFGKRIATQNLSLDGYKRRLNMNLLNETLENLKRHNKTEADILWVSGSIEQQDCGKNDYYISWEEFKNNSNFSYNNGYGSHEINASLIIVGNNFWLERHIYDGSECWKYKEFPTKPKKHYNQDHIQNKFIKNYEPWMED